MQAKHFYFFLFATLVACVPAWNHAHAGPIESIIEDWVSDGLSPPPSQCSGSNEDYLGQSTGEDWVEGQLTDRCQQAAADSGGITPITVYACYSSTIEDDDFSGSLEPRVVCYCDNFFCNEEHSEVFEDTVDTIMGISGLLS